MRDDENVSYEQRLLRAIWRANDAVHRFQDMRDKLRAKAIQTSDEQTRVKALMLASRYNRLACHPMQRANSLYNALEAYTHTSVLPKQPARTPRLSRAGAWLAFDDECVVDGVRL